MKAVNRNAEDKKDCEMPSVLCISPSPLIPSLLGVEDTIIHVWEPSSPIVCLIIWWKIHLKDLFFQSVSLTLPRNNRMSPKKPNQPNKKIIATSGSTTLHPSVPFVICLNSTPLVYFPPFSLPLVLDTGDALIQIRWFPAGIMVVLDLFISPTWSPPAPSCFLNSFSACAFSGEPYFSPNPSWSSRWMKELAHTFNQMWNVLISFFLW